MFYVYVLQSRTDRGLYIGFSKNLKQRLATHRLGKAFATSFRAPWKLIYYEAYLEEADALGRENILRVEAVGDSCAPNSSTIYERIPYA
jgi:putative endonuclease